MDKIEELTEALRDQIPKETDPIEQDETPNELPSTSGLEEVVETSEAPVPENAEEPENVEEQILNVEGDFLATGAFEEIVMEQECEEEYDCSVNNQFEQNMIYDLYQPLETDDSLICKICLQLGKHIEFEDKQQYSSHRYKVHGTYNNCVLCPVFNCREVYASMIVLRKHLMTDHKLPLEMHHQTFANMNEFERWRHLVELASNCRFMMHTKQPNYKRQVMHCSRSEHKMVLQSKKHRLPRLRMLKEGACCPAFISFRLEEKTGQIHAFYQLVHVGHATQEETEPESQENNLFTIDSRGTGRLPSLHFPEKPLYLGERAMQHVQIDLIEMDSTIYYTVIYSSILIVTDLHTGFMWAKPIPGPVQKQLILRIVTDIFSQFGVPEGFCCSASQSQRLIRDVMNGISDVFRVDMREIFNEMPDYDWLRNNLAEEAQNELKSTSRWVEMLPFSVMSMNQTGNKSPFERMFKRKPFGDTSPPWLNEENVDYGPVEDETQAPVSARYQVGDKVYLRNLDNRPGRGNSLPYLFGVIGAVDWKEFPHFPYKVHYSKTSDPWPSELNTFTWVTPYDVLPTTHDLMMIRDEDRRRVMSTLLCACRDMDSSSEPCTLFRSPCCNNGMSRACCTLCGNQCSYHDLLRGEESYAKTELISRYYSNQSSAEEKRRLGELIRTRFSKGNSVEISSENLEVETIDVGSVHDDSPSFIGQRPNILRQRRPTKSASRIVVHSREEEQSVPGDGRRVVQIITDHDNQSPKSSPMAKRRRLTQDHVMSHEHSMVEHIKQESSEDHNEETSTQSTRRSGRPVKAKTFDDFISH